MVLISIIKLLLARINQVYFWRFFYKHIKHYTYSQLILKQTIFTKINKNAKQQGLGWEILNLEIKFWSAKVKNKSEELLIKIKEYSEQMNIYKLSHNLRMDMT
jgi:hypothetical protein